MKIIEKILFLLILVLLVLPAVQKEFRLVNEPELRGDFNKAEQPDYSWEGWFSGDYQSGVDQYIKDHIGFNPSLVRLYNQLDFSLFRVSHAEGVVSGKGGQLFEYDYIRAYTGGDYLGKPINDLRIRQLKFVQRYLKDSLNIDLLFILEPGKASFYPEFLPDKDLRNQIPTTNYKCLVELAESYDIHYVDFNRWFKSMAPEARYPLYPQHGIHWSEYGMSLAVDSLLRLIRETRHINMREVYVDTIYLENQARPPDYDIGSVLNLAFRLKESEPLAYPEFRFEENAEHKDYPMVLAVGDSYYWNIFNSRIPKEVFKNEAFWYFGKLVYPDYYYQPTFVEQLNIREEVEKQDVILLMTTERFLYKFDWRFIDALYSIYGVTSKFNKLPYYINYVLFNDEWFSNVIGKAKKRNISLEEMLVLEAKYIYHENEPLQYDVYYGLNDILDKMRTDDPWMDLLAGKAEEKNISLEEMMQLDAEYMMAQYHPDAYQTWQTLHAEMDRIMKDSTLREAAKKEADYYCISLEDMVMIQAEQQLEELPPISE